MDLGSSAVAASSRPDRALHALLGSALALLLTSHRTSTTLLYATHMKEREPMSETRSEILQGTLDLMVLKTLDAMGPMHGYGIARRIEQVSEDAMQVNQGTIYLCLIRLVQKRWITSEWGASENNRRAKFYAISKAGRKQLATETANWERVAGVIGRVLQLARREP
jgi:PadR family transcriptional regulator PadR